MATEQSKDEGQSESKDARQRERGGEQSKESEDLKEREYRDEQGNVHHHTRTYEDQHKKE